MSRYDVALHQCITGPYNRANAFRICTADFSPAVSDPNGGPPFLADPDMFSFGISAACLPTPIAGLVQSETHACNSYLQHNLNTTAASSTCHQLNTTAASSTCHQLNKTAASSTCNRVHFLQTSFQAIV